MQLSSPPLLLERKKPSSCKELGFFCCFDRCGSLCHEFHQFARIELLSSFRFVQFVAKVLPVFSATNFTNLHESSSCLRDNSCNSWQKIRPAFSATNFTNFHESSFCLRVNSCNSWQKSAQLFLPRISASASRRRCSGSRPTACSESPTAGRRSRWLSAPCCPGDRSPASAPPR